MCWFLWNSWIDAIQRMAWSFDLKEDRAGGCWICSRLSSVGSCRHGYIVRWCSMSVMFTSLTSPSESMLEYVCEAWNLLSSNSCGWWILVKRKPDFHCWWKHMFAQCKRGFETTTRVDASWGDDYQWGKHGEQKTNVLSLGSYMRTPSNIENKSNHCI